MYKRPQNLYAEYHAHLYYDAQTLAHASDLAHRAAGLTEVKVGRVHQRPVGPHPRWSCQLAFGAERFEQVISWLECHRDGLTVLVHGVTGDELKDHTEHAAWLGEAEALDLSVFRS